MESAPTFFVGTERGTFLPCCVCRGDHWSPVNLPPQRIFRDSFLARQTGTGEQCSPLQMFFGSLSPKYSCPPHVSLPHRLRAEPPRRGGQERAVPLRGVFSLWPKTKSVGAHSICARGSLSYSKRARADMESAPTFFEAAEHQPSRGVTAGESYSFRGRCLPNADFKGL